MSNEDIFHKGKKNNTYWMSTMQPSTEFDSLNTCPLNPTPPYEVRIITPFCR